MSDKLNAGVGAMGIAPWVRAKMISEYLYPLENQQIGTVLVLLTAALCARPDAQGVVHPKDLEEMLAVFAAKVRATVAWNRKYPDAPEVVVIPR